MLSHSILNVFCSGNAKTGLQRNLKGLTKTIIVCTELLLPAVHPLILSIYVSYIQESLLYPASYGALTQLYAGTSKEGANLNGKVRLLSILMSPTTITFPFFQYLIPWARVHAPKAKTQDPKLGKELWAWLEEQVKDV